MMHAHTRPARGFQAKIHASARTRASTRFVRIAMIGLIGMLLIGAIAGWLAGQLFRGVGFGVLGNIAVGIVGALIGGFLFGNVFIVGGLLGQIISATIGAVILLFVISLVKR
jgi:uncharacterized membrane protein YeaQ/YmgE (transglycosylase-associated protein family)